MLHSCDAAIGIRRYGMKIRQAQNGDLSRVSEIYVFPQVFSDLSNKNHVSGKRRSPRCFFPVPIDGLHEVFWSQIRSVHCRFLSEIYVFNNRINFYPIFKDAHFSFGALQVVSLIDNYFAKDDIRQNLYVYDNGLIKGFLLVWTDRNFYLFVKRSEK